MSKFYIVRQAGELFGPVMLIEVPGIGVQIPEEAIELAEELGAPADGFVWALVDGQPQQLADHRGAVYSTVDGTESQHNELGELPNGFTAKAWPGRFYMWTGDSWTLDETAQSEAGKALERAWRNAEIAATDYLAMPDYPITADQRSGLYAYRQALRDWPGTGQFPDQQDRPRPPAWIIELTQELGI